MVDTSVLAKSNMDREYLFFLRGYLFSFLDPSACELVEADATAGENMKYHIYTHATTSMVFMVGNCWVIDFMSLKHLQCEALKCLTTMPTIRLPVWLPLSTPAPPIGWAQMQISLFIHHNMQTK
jgi:hypothetical protein